MRIRRVFLYGTVAFWLLVTLLALGAMYRLWWTREHALYAGRSPDEQRRIVLERAGIPVRTLDVARAADAGWPLDGNYEDDGAEVTLSYFRYLMLPRIPVDSSARRIEERGSEYALQGVEPESNSAPRPFSTVPPTPRGLILSALALLGLAAGLTRHGFSLPEGLSAAVLALAIAGALAQGTCGSFAPAGFAICLLGAAGWAWFAAGRRWARESRPANQEPASPADVWIGRAALAILAASAVWALLMAAAVVPDDWDAWAQWGPKAKILAVSGGALAGVGEFVPGSGDYPLLWPATWAFSGWCAGGWEEQWSKGWGAIFLWLAAWQLQIVAVRSGQRRGPAWLFAAAFASMPAVPLVASWGYAEAPFWLALACATGRLLAWQAGGRRSELWRAGLFMAGAACTKNEGLLFAALGVVWVAAAGRKWRDVVAIGLPVALCAGAWKLYVAVAMDVTNHSLAALGGDFPAPAEWLRRLATAGGYIGRQWLDVQQWNVVLPAALAVAVWLAIRGGARQRFGLLLPFGLLGGLLLVVLMYGDNWLWQLGVAWNRLTIQFMAVLLPVLAAGLCSCPGRPER